MNDPSQIVRLGSTERSETQDHPETPQHRTQPDALRPSRAVREIELGFLVRCGLDPHGRRIRSTEPRSALGTHPPSDPWIRAVEPFRADDLDQRRRQQRRVADQQRVQPIRPLRVGNTIIVADRASRRRPLHHFAIVAG
jgi:hypothetical protein